MLEADDVQVSDVCLDPQDCDYCQRRSRKYAWWYNVAAAIRKFGANTAEADAGLIQEKLDSTAQMCRMICKNVAFGVKLKHFLYKWSSPEVKEEHAAVVKRLSEKTKRRLEDGSDSLSSKRRKGNGGSDIPAEAGPMMMNSGIGKKGKRATNNKMVEDFDEDDLDAMVDDGCGGSEPKWFKCHCEMHRVLNLPDSWKAVSDTTPPPEYTDNGFYASLRWRDRDIIKMLDAVSPLAALENEVGVDLPPMACLPSL